MVRLSSAELAKFRRWPQLLLTLFAIGTVSGPLLDGIHSLSQLQIYDTGAIQIGDGKFALKTDIWVGDLAICLFCIAAHVHSLCPKVR
jgi:hypothetical protein